MRVRKSLCISQKGFRVVFFCFLSAFLISGNKIAFDADLIVAHPQLAVARVTMALRFIKEISGSPATSSLPFSDCLFIGLEF